MKAKPCGDCCMRRQFEENPRSLMARFWRWHLRFCPGWKAYMQTLSPEERQQIAERYHLKQS